MENLGLDIKLIVAQGINFIVFFYIFKKFIAKPFFKFLNEEKEKEKEKLKLEEEINQKKESFILEEKKKKEALKKELTLLKEELKKEINQEKEKIIAQAEKKAEMIKEKAQKELEMEKRKLEMEMKKKVGEVVLILMENGLKDLLTTEMEKKLTTNIIKNFKAQKIN